MPGSLVSLLNSIPFVLYSTSDPISNNADSEKFIANQHSQSPSSQQLSYALTNQQHRNEQQQISQPSQSYQQSTLAAAPPPPSSSPPQQQHQEIDYEALPENSTVLAQLTAGAFAGIMEHSLMYPIDVIKTRMQLFLTLNPNKNATGAAASIAKKASENNGIIRSIVKVTSAEGSFALWRGISSVLLGAGPAHAVYFGVFEHTKTLLVNNFVKSQNKQITTLITDENHPFIAAASGIAATTASDALMTPFDILKQRMQTIKSLQHQQGQPKAQSSVNFNIYNVAKKIYVNEGFKAFWISYPATLLLNIPFAAINFGVYEYASSVLNPLHTYNPLLHCVAGGISGACAAAITNPLDFIKTFLQTKGLSNDAQITGIKGFKEAVAFVLKKENGGWKNFLKGIRPRILFNIPSTAISWTSYEMAKSYLC